MTIPQALHAAFQHHQSGRLGEAEVIYRQILAAEPRYVEALHHLGIIAQQVGRHDLAIDLIRQAIALDPGNATAHFNLGGVYGSIGRTDESIAAYRDAARLQPDLADAHYLLGYGLKERHRYDESIPAFRRAIELRPDYPEAHFHLGNVLNELGQFEEAVIAFRRALEFKSDYGDALNNLGIALRNLGRLDEAVAAYRQAIRLQPEDWEAYSNLGNSLADQDHLAEAVEAYRKAIQLQPGRSEAHSNLGAVLGCLGQLDEGIAECRRALELQPDHVRARWNGAILLLKQGDFEQGWPLYEARWEGSEPKRERRNFSQPMWQGEALHGQRILIHAEQGFGDTLQFVRYAPLVAERGGEVIVECQPGLKSLLASVDGVAQVVAFGEPLPAFDHHCPMLSLPLAFGTRLETIPAAVPYIRADPRKAAQWRERLERESGAGDPVKRSPIKIGLAWAGGERLHLPKVRTVDRRRSMHLNQFAPLAEIPGVVFVSLQKGGPSAQAKSPPEGMRLLDWTDELEDFSDTAALVEGLDLVICVDTAVTHLAGALGKPVWLLNRFDTCWRWLTDREDSPWYPTMRLFRQPTFLDWQPVLARVQQQLERLSTEHFPI